jgi:hypothetical protein
VQSSSNKIPVRSPVIVKKWNPNPFHLQPKHRTLEPSKYIATKYLLTENKAYCVAGDLQYTKYQQPHNIPQPPEDQQKIFNIQRHCQT